MAKRKTTRRVKQKCDLSCPVCTWNTLVEWISCTANIEITPSLWLNIGLEKLGLSWKF